VRRTDRAEPLDSVAAGARRPIPSAGEYLAELHRLAAQRDLGLGGVPVTAAEIAASLGNSRRCGRWWRTVCPVHGSRTGRSLSLALRDHVHGIAVNCHAGCNRDDIIDELRRQGLIAGHTDDARPVPLTVPSDDGANAARRIAIARRIWDAARDARRSPAVRYLAGRGITLPVPPSLRWAPSLRRPDGIYAPAMVARVNSLDGELIGVHRTWIARDAAGIWHRQDRASLGPVGGGAVRLVPAAKTLMIAEGIETALSVIQATGQPVWSALSTSGLIALRLPPIVRFVTILADNDANCAGERAAHKAAQRWLSEGRRVRIAMPAELDTDFADVLMGAAYAPTAELCDAAA
jgi:hypothetical protein